MDDAELLRLAGSLRRRTLARTQAGAVTISTIHMVTGYKRLDGHEFETAVIRGDRLRVVERYRTEAGALTGHDLYVSLHLRA